MTNTSFGRKLLINLIYIIGLIYLILQGLYYAHKVPDTSPDEMAHISYIYYLRNTGELLPHFEDMVIFDPVPMEGSDMQFTHSENLVNYLCHPPLYYHIMRLAGGFKDIEKWDVVEIDRWRLRYFSLGISVIGVLLIMYLGWSRISKEKPFLHFIYVVTATCVPIMCFEMCGVSNDALALITTSICALGLIRFCENNRNLLTYLLIIGGITTSLLNKMTSGMLCVIMALIVLLVTIIKERAIKASLKKEFWFVAPLLILPLIYVAVIYSRYGVLQPTVKQIASYEYFKTTFFYVAEPDRINVTKKIYTLFFFNNFFISWSGLVTMFNEAGKTNPFAYTTLPIEIMWLSPLLLVFKKVRRAAKGCALPIFAGFISSVTTVLLQYKKGYGNYIANGYLGGTQARYYVPMVFIFALAIVFAFAVSNSSNKKAIRGFGYLVGTGYALLLLYVNFIYYYILLS